MLSFFVRMMTARFSRLKNRLLNSFVPGIAWWLIVLALMCTPGKDFPSLGSWTELIRLDKLIHIIVFALMVYFFNRSFAEKAYSYNEKKQLYLKIAIACAIWGLTIEFIQHFWIPGRTLDLYDFFADSAGCYLAYRYSKRYLLL